MPTTWTNTSGGTASWSNSHYDFKNIWGEWASYTWGDVEASSYSWGDLAGLTFDTTTSSSTTWVNV